MPLRDAHTVVEWSENEMHVSNSDSPVTHLLHPSWRTRSKPHFSIFSHSIISVYISPLLASYSLFVLPSFLWSRGGDVWERREWERAGSPAWLAWAWKKLLLFQSWLRGQGTSGRRLAESEPPLSLSCSSSALGQGQWGVGKRQHFRQSFRHILKYKHKNKPQSQI